MKQIKTSRRKKSTAMSKKEAEDEIRYLRSLIETHLKPRLVDGGFVEKCTLCGVERVNDDFTPSLVHKKHCYFARGQTT